MRKLIGAILLLVFLPFGSMAQEVECTDRPECWPDGSSMQTGLQTRNYEKTQQIVLQRKYDDLIELVSSAHEIYYANGQKNDLHTDDRLVAALKRQQKGWENYKSDECELIGSLTGSGGTWPSTYAARCEANLTDTRILRITSAIKCIQKISDDKRLWNQNGCLQQLAPLANRIMQ